MIKRIIFSYAVAIYIALGASIFVVANYSTVFAAEGSECTPETTSFLGLPTWYKYLTSQEDSTGRCSPVLSESKECSDNPELNGCSEKKVNSALPIGLAVLEGMLRISGLVAVVMIFWSGFKYITTQGNPEAAAGARKTAINALVGLVIVILATTLVSFVGNSLLPTSTTGNNSTQINQSGGIQ